MSMTIDGHTNQWATIVRHKSGSYGSGDPTTLYENISCRFVEYGETKWDATAGAQIEIGTAQAWFDDELKGVRNGDKFLYKEAQEYTIVKIRRLRDIDGKLDHTKVILS